MNTAHMFHFFCVSFYKIINHETLYCPFFCFSLLILILCVSLERMSDNVFEAIGEPDLMNTPSARPPPPPPPRPPPMPDANRKIDTSKIQMKYDYVPVPLTPLEPGTALSPILVSLSSAFHTQKPHPRDRSRERHRDKTPPPPRRQKSKSPRRRRSRSRSRNRSRGRDSQKKQSPERRPQKPLLSSYPWRSQKPLSRDKSPDRRPSSSSSGYRYSSSSRKSPERRRVSPKKPPPLPPLPKSVHKDVKTPITVVDSSSSSSSSSDDEDPDVKRMRRERSIKLKECSTKLSDYCASVVIPFIDLFTEESAGLVESYLCSVLSPSKHKEFLNTVTLNSNAVYVLDVLRIQSRTIVWFTFRRGHSTLDRDVSIRRAIELIQSKLKTDRYDRLFAREYFKVYDCKHNTSLEQLMWSDPSHSIFRKDNWLSASGNSSGHSFVGVIAIGDGGKLAARHKTVLAQFSTTANSSFVFSIVVSVSMRGVQFEHVHL